MIVRSDDYVKYCRETAKSASKLHDLALRGMSRQMAWWQLTDKPSVILPSTAHAYFAPAGEFIAIAADAGLEPVRCWQHDYPNTRNNYLFRKPM